MTHQITARAIGRLETRSALDETDRQAIRDLPFICRTLEPNSYLVREGEPPEHCAILISGFAYRQKLTGDGGRQILSLNLPGEFLDLQNSLLDVADHSVQALSRVDVAFVPVRALRRLTQEHPRVARAMWIETLIDGSVFREWIINVGRRDSMSRMAHLLCEFTLRLEAAGLARDRRFELPMTQEQIADSTGLTPVHVNRVLKELGRIGVIGRDRRSLSILDWDRLRAVGDFNSRYLHIREDGLPDLATAA